MDAFTHRLNVGRRFGSRIAAGDAVFQTGARGVVALPFTVTNGEARPLSGANLFILLQVMKDRGWSDPRFFTEDQVMKAGWVIAPGAAGVHLQYLKATGMDGLPLEAPEAKVFSVFNANEIVGVPELSGELSASADDVIEAAARAGHVGLQNEGTSAVLRWLSSLQVDSGRGRVGAAGVGLRSGMAACLLSVQTGLSHEVGSLQKFSMEWVREIEEAPLSFFKAVRDAEKLAAAVMVQVRAVALERAAVMAVAAAGDQTVGGADGAAVGAVKSVGAGSTMGSDMGARKSGSARLAKMFEERAAALAVPFSDKDRAAALGAMWYGPLKMWFVPKGLEVDAFKEWNPRSHVLGVVATRETLIDSFRDAMADLGLDIPAEIEADGKWHNVRVPANKGKNLSGSYILSLTGGRDGEAIGTILNKFSGESFTWKHDGPLMTPEEKARLKAEVLEREAKAEREAAQAREMAACHANEIWALGREISTGGYVGRKGIDGEGLREVAGEVLLRYPEFHGESGKSAIRPHEIYTLVPLSTEAGKLRAVQAISRDGTVKSFMRGAQKKGLMCVLGAPSFDALCETEAELVGFGEGVATCASLRAGSGVPVVVCFDADNLETVVGAVASRLPAGMGALIGADNDQFYVERVAGMLADTLGLNPRGIEGGVVKVASGIGEVRTAALGEAIADGEWHDSPKGRYRISLNYETGSDVVRSVTVEIVPTGGRKSRSTFENRGLEAGRCALSAVDNAGVKGMLAVPVFASLAGRPTDWNDLHHREGVGMVREKLGALGVDMRVERGYAAERMPERVGMYR